MTELVVLAICAFVIATLLLPFRGRPLQSRTGKSRDDPTATLSLERADSPPSIPAADSSEAERRTVLDEKDRLFGALADLRFDYEAGKLSREDFEAEQADLERRAAALLRQLS